MNRALPCFAVLPGQCPQLGQRDAWTDGHRDRMLPPPACSEAKSAPACHQGGLARREGWGGGLLSVPGWRHSGMYALVSVCVCLQGCLCGCVPVSACVSKCTCFCLNEPVCMCVCDSVHISVMDVCQCTRVCLYLKCHLQPGISQSPRLQGQLPWTHARLLCT